MCYTSHIAFLYGIFAFIVNLSLCLGRPCFRSSNVFLFCWAAFLSISLLASVFPVSLPLFFLFFRPCLIHARMPERGRAFVHGHTFLHSWSGPMTVVVGLLHGATFLSNLKGPIHDSDYSTATAICNQIAVAVTVDCLSTQAATDLFNFSAYTD